MDLNVGPWRIECRMNNAWQVVAAWDVNTNTELVGKWGHYLCTYGKSEACCSRQAVYVFGCFTVHSV